MNLSVILFLGYLIGSLSPGYFFGQLVKHIDIRRFGNKNTGATNTYHVVGPVFGILTGIFDFAKAPLAYYLTASGSLPFLPRIEPDLAILAGLAVVVGHIKPFYLNFKGGMGVAPLWGLCMVTILYTRSIFALLLISGTVIYTIHVSRSLKFTHPLRQVLKLGMLVIPLAAIWVPKDFILLIILLLFLLFALLDVIRVINPNINKRYLNLKIFAKEKERFRPSGSTLLFLSALLVFWLFSEDIAVISLACFLVGDSLAPMGQRFLSVQLLGSKTLGGALVVFFASLLTGLFLQSLTPLSLSFTLIITAAVSIATLDQFSFLIDDNLLVPFGTAVALTILRIPA